MGSQEVVGESAGVTGRGLLNDEELGKMAVRINSSVCRAVRFPHLVSVPFYCCVSLST